MRFAILSDVTVGLDPLLEPHASYFYPNQNHFDLGYQPELLQKTEKGIGPLPDPLLSRACAASGTTAPATGPTFR